MKISLLAIFLLLPWHGALADSTRPVDRDFHRRSISPMSEADRHYTPPRIYYPRQPGDAMRVEKPQRPSVQPVAPPLGAPPPVLERIPRP